MPDELDNIIKKFKKFLGLFPDKPDNNESCENGSFAIALIAGISAIYVAGPYGAILAVGFVAFRRFVWECLPTSPLVLDLDSDGIEANSLTFFDHEGDGLLA